jgi:outer membrane protein TolC
VIALAAALVASGLTLRDVQERARQNDPRAQQALAQLENARGKNDEVKWAVFPSIETTAYLAGPTPEHFLHGGQNDPNPSDPTHLRTNDYFGGPMGVVMHADVQIIQGIYSFGKYQAGTSATRNLVAAQEALLERARDQAAFDATRAWWGWQTARNAGDNVQKIHDRLQQAKDTADKLIAAESDQISKADRLKLDYLAEETEAQQASALKNRDLAAEGMRILLGLAEGAAIDIEPASLPDPPAQPDANAVLSRALDRRPEVRAANAAVEGRQALVDLESARYWPDLAIVAGARFTETTNASNPQSPFVYNPYHEATGYAALALHGSFEIPVKMARKRQAEANLAEAVALRQEATQLVRLEVQQALGDLAEARVRADRYTKETAIGKQLATQAGVAFDSGLGEARELLEDTLLYARADGERLKALFDAQVAWAALEKAAGGPVQ